MSAPILKKIHPSQWLAALFLLAMTGAVIKLAIALTAYTPQNQPTGYVGQEIVTNGTLTSGNESLFRADYEKQYWSGNLYDYPIDANGNINTAAERWSGGVAAHLVTQNFSTGRYIGTLKDDGSKIPFLSASLSATQQSSLVTTVNGVSYTSTLIANYLRGDQSNEGLTTLRQRFSPLGTGTTNNVLGDILHSRPYYLADATNPTIFVGANDGMLHAFNTTTGNERWAYVPSMLISKMKALAANPYTHDYYVDGQIGVGYAAAGNATRILVGGLGAGGKGLYALNIDGSAGLSAASDQDAANKVIWEITPTTVNYATPQMFDGSTYSSSSGYGNLGYSYGTPQIKTINNGGTAEQVVIVGNGYNNGGDYQAYLFIINAADGKLVRAIKADSNSTNNTGTAVTNGTASSPNGLFNSVVFDSNSDGYVDTVYAGDLNGTMWKFNLSSATPSAWSASVLYVTSPKQPITATPAALPHPSGSGYMVNFATGGIFSGTQSASGVTATGDLGDTSTFYVYGIWDGAPATNTTLVTPTLTERCYNTAGTPTALPCTTSETRVRRISASAPNWSAGGDKGWKVALPVAGERVVGEGSFISSGRYYFSTYNPTISYLVPNTTTYVWGENWQMALDAVTGGSIDPFMDLNSDGVVTSADRIKYTSSDAEVVAGTQTANTPIITPNVDGISVGKWVSRGVQSQPTLVKLTALFTTLFNTNPDVYFPPTTAVVTGVTGGHFDEDIYYGAVTTSAQATATITVGSTGNNAPATLGGIQIDGVNIVPALTVSDITNGSSTSTNAATIASKVTGGTYTATVFGSTVTIKAPVGSSYNGKTLTVLAGSSSSTPGTAPSNGSIVITDASKGNTASLKCGNTYIGNTGSFSIANSNTKATRLDGLYNNITSNQPVNGYTVSCTKSTSSGATTALNCSVAAPVGASACSSGFTINNITTTTNTGPSGGTNPVVQWSNLAPALSVTSFSGGADGGTAGDTCTSCKYKTHVHQYDKVYDVTGVDMLNPNNTAFNLAVALPSAAQNFKVIIHNQYLNPAAKINIGNTNYLPGVDFGYISVKNYTTSATLDLATLPTYNRNPASTGDGLTAPKYIGSLVINMPVDALTAKNWWGNGDVRSGLMPTTPQCIWSSAGTNDGNMYQPVIAPANDAVLGYPLDGKGTLGYSGSTTPATATGVRHGGALTIQIIRDTTPNSALELNDSRGRPEYGWRVKSAYFSTYVLAEYNTYWHHPNGLCFGSTGWTKAPGPDTGGNPPSPTHTPGATDPKIGNLTGNGSNVASVVTTGNSTTITYIDSSRDVIVRVVNSDGTVTTTTIHIPAGVSGEPTETDNGDHTETVTVAGVSGIVGNGGSITLSNGATVTSTTTANAAGSSGTGGLLNQNAIGYRRISWKELIRN